MLSAGCSDVSPNSASEDTALRASRGGRSGNGIGLVGVSITDRAGPHPPPGPPVRPAGGRGPPRGHSLKLPAGAR